jgi:hypothetical protein
LKVYYHNSQIQGYTKPIFQVRARRARHLSFFSIHGTTKSAPACLRPGKKIRNLMSWSEITKKSEKIFVNIPQKIKTLCYFKIRVHGKNRDQKVFMLLLNLTVKAGTAAQRKKKKEIVMGWRGPWW